jgi:hypothetical protein
MLLIAINLTCRIFHSLMCDPFRSIHGKLCFGQLESGQFAAAEKSAEVRHKHRDNWEARIFVFVMFL